MGSHRLSPRPHRTPRRCRVRPDRVLVLQKHQLRALEGKRVWRLAGALRGRRRRRCPPARPGRAPHMPATSLHSPVELTPRLCVLDRWWRMEYLSPRGGRRVLAVSQVEWGGRWPGHRQGRPQEELGTTSPVWRHPRQDTQTFTCGKAAHPAPGKTGAAGPSLQTRKRRPGVWSG